MKERREVLFMLLCVCLTLISFQLYSFVVLAVILFHITKLIITRISSSPWCLTHWESPDLASLYARAAITKHHRLGGLNNRNLFSQSSGGWKSKTKGPAGFLSPVASLLSLQVPHPFAASWHVFDPVCIYSPVPLSVFVRTPAILA